MWVVTEVDTVSYRKRRDGGEEAGAEVIEHRRKLGVAFNLDILLAGRDGK